MKKSITLIALLAGAVGVQAQGTVNFQTYLTTWNIAVWSPQVATPTVEVQGNTSTDLPAGTTSYTGVPIGGSASGSGPTGYGNGANYEVGLYAVAGTTAPSLAGTTDLLATGHFATSGGTGAANVVNGANGGLAGSWVGNASVAIPSAGTGLTGVATVELAAWYSGGGATSYAAAVAAGVPTGVSAVATLDGLGGANVGSPASFPATLGAVTSFSLTTTPEPSTIALGVMGASAFLMRLRRKL
jgi:hypothetical protein